MAVTSTQTPSDGVARVATGRYLTSSTAAAIEIACGFTPKFVSVLNMTSGDSYQWMEGMADASALKQVAAGTSSIITTLGITPSISTGQGFTIGLDLDVNVINEQLSWLAIG